MNFTMTTFMYPLNCNDRPRFLGKLYFDNPRSTEEVKYVAQILKKANLSGKSSFADKPGLVPENCITLMTIYDYFYKNNCADPLVQQFEKKNGRIKDIYHKLAKMWVIVRSEEVIDEEDRKGGFVLHRSVEDETKIGLINNYTKSIIECNQEKIADYFAFITFMLGKGYLSTNLIYDDPIEDNFENKNIFILLLTMSIIKPTKKDIEKGEIPCGIFKYIEPNIITLSDKVGERNKDKKFLFICRRIHNILNLYNTNSEMAFIELISVIELLITHNPDSMRFNVEESITKQFIGKLTFLLYERDKTIDISDLKKELTLAYSIRSAIAHGNFGELEKHLDKLFSHYGYKRNAAGIDYRDNDNALRKLLSNASDWLRIVIECYLEDERKLNLIKAV